MRNKLARLNVSKALNTSTLDLASIIENIVKNEIFVSCNEIIDFMTQCNEDLEELYYIVDKEFTVENVMYNMSDDDVREILIDNYYSKELAEILNLGCIYEHEYLVEKLNDCVDLANKFMYSSFFDADYFLENYVDEYQYKEPLEFWIISSWLADKLIDLGECVDKDVKGLCVWGRCTSGQNISMDSVIIEVAKQL